MATLNYTVTEINERLGWAESAHDILEGSGSGSGGIVSIISEKVKTQADNSSEVLYVTGVTAPNADLKYNTNVYTNCNSGRLYGAAWNDYAEYREVSGEAKAGQCMIENGDGTVSCSNDRLKPFAGIISDTYGMCIGIHSDDSEPIAMSGRVLVYSNEELKVGDCVCSGINGTVSKMSRDEIKEYPDRIVGIVSEIPTYKVWDDRVIVNGRIWIKVK